MNSIKKSKGLFSKNATLIAGSLFLITGILSAWDHNFLLAGLYILIGASGIIIGLNNRNVDMEFIKWDNDSLSIKDSSIVAQYSWVEIEKIYIDHGHLKIKTGRANGIILDLTGYSKTDLEILKEKLLPLQENSITA